MQHVTKLQQVSASSWHTQQRVDLCLLLSPSGSSICQSLHLHAHMKLCSTIWWFLLASCCLLFFCVSTANLFRFRRVHTGSTSAFFFFYVLQSVYWVLSAAKTCMTYTQCCAWLRHRRRTADAALLLWLRALCRVSILVGHCPISLYSKEHLYVLFYFSHLATQLSQHDFVCLSHTNMNTWPRNPLTPGQIEPSQIWKPYLFLRCMLTVNWWFITFKHTEWVRALLVFFSKYICMSH